MARECHQAQQRLFELRMYGRDGDQAPDTFGEFLYRSHAATWHEPAASRRARGARPRK